ncbi:uncharacterized protein [Leptinotarsa decemlineata]|uniref:uncharacterized protein n=1 Tax=Leptinotarsa decemlineata TaxID=7539 RepID=UPI003D3078D4
MIIRICFLFLLYLVASVDKIECRKKSSTLIGRHTSHPNPVHLSYGSSRTTTRRSYIRTTTPRIHHRTTTRRHYITTTRRHHITTNRRHHITTTPSYITTTPGRKKITTRRRVLPTKSTRTTHYQTTTPRQQRTTKKVQNRTDTYLTRPPPFNPFFTPSQPKITHTNPPPYNPFFSTTRIVPVSRQPAHNPFFTSTARPLNSVLNKTTPIPRQPPYNPYFTSSIPTVFSSSNKTSIRNPNISPSNFSALAIPVEFNKTSVTKRPTHNPTPPYNPFFSTTRIIPVSRQPPYNPFVTSTVRPLNSVLNKTTPIPRQPPYNPYFTSTRPTDFFTSNKSSITKLNNSHTNFSSLAIPGEFNKTSMTKRPAHNSTFISSGGKNGTFITNPNPFGEVNTTSLNSAHNSALVFPKPSIGGLNKTSSEQLGSQTTWGSQYPENGLVQATNRSYGFVYHPPGQKRNVTSNFRQPLHNVPLSNGYITNPPYPSYNSFGNQYPGGSYVPGGQSQPNIGLTIINNNVHNNNHHVVYPTQHYTGYGSPASGVTIVNNNYDHYHNSPIPQYHYSSRNTGSTLLGAFLGYQLGKISRPTYYYYGTSIVNDKYVPVYNHYEVHHYYHNGDKVPQQAEITANTIVPCAGDSGLLCPQNTSPLCTNNGAVMCVSSNTVPCDKDKNLNCVRSSVPCSGISTTECIQRTATSVYIPCISTAKLSGISQNNSDSTESSVCVTILALPAENKLAKPKKIRVEISIPFHYTTNDSGIDPLGYYLGQQLEKLESPSYLYLNYDKYYRYKEKYDHYNIHHFYHNATIVPRVVEIKPHVVMDCAGDSGTICPQNTRSLCMTDGAVACVTDTNSKTFSNDTKMNYSYVNSSIPCANSTDPMCSNINTTVPIVIPCISTAKIFANMSNLISTFTTKKGVTKYYNTLVLQVSNTTPNATHQMIPKPRQFCVAVLLTPSEKIKVKVPLKRKVTGVSRSYMAVPTYQYKLEATGNKTLGYYLSNRLGRLKYPTYYYMVQKEAIQKFDHYSVHHYHQGKEIIPIEMDLYAESISACLGDSGTFCPANTTSLCLNDSSVMCVTDVLLTEPCEKTKGTNCVKSTLPCLDNKAPKCRKGVKRVHVTMPCMSVATVFGDIMYVNNTIYTSSSSDTQSYIDIQRIPKRTVNSTTPYDRAQQFCITIIVLPAERNISEGEKLLKSSKNVFLNFAMNMFGIS